MYIRVQNQHHFHGVEYVNMLLILDWTIHSLLTPL